MLQSCILGRICLQAHPFWEAGAELPVTPPVPDVIIPTEDELNSAVQVRTSGVDFTAL